MPSGELSVLAVADPEMMRALRQLRQTVVQWSYAMPNTLASLGAAANAMAEAEAAEQAELTHATFHHPGLGHTRICDEVVDGFSLYWRWRSYEETWHADRVPAAALLLGDICCCCNGELVAVQQEDNGYWHLVWADEDGQICEQSVSPSTDVFEIQRKPREAA